MPADDRPGALQLARYCARAPLALARITYDPDRRQVLVASDKADGPTAGTHAFDPLDFLAQLLTHIPRKGEHLVRYYGAYSSRVRGTWRRQGVGPWVERELGDGDGGRPSHAALDPHDDRGECPVATLPEPPSPARTALSKRWAELLRRIFEVNPLTCPRCRGPMRIIAFILDPVVIDAILRHLRRAHHDARAGPWADAGQIAPQMAIDPPGSA